jgi:hypothetical protein
LGDGSAGVGVGFDQDVVGVVGGVGGRSGHKFFLNSRKFLVNLKR